MIRKGEGEPMESMLMNLYKCGRNYRMRTKKRRINVSVLSQIPSSQNKKVTITWSDLLTTPKSILNCPLYLGRSSHLELKRLALIRMNNLHFCHYKPLALLSASPLVHSQLETSNAADLPVFVRFSATNSHLIC